MSNDLGDYVKAGLKLGQEMRSNHSRHLTYLASPYTHKEAMTREIRFNLAVSAASELIKMGELVFSPIAHTHPIAVHGSLPQEWGYWNEFDTRMIKACDSVTVLKLFGWEESVGVQAEIQIAKELDKQIRFMDPNTMKIID